MANIAQIPNIVAAGAEIDDTSNTAVVEGAGGYSGRESVRQIPLRNFHLTIGPNEVAEVRSIFLTHRRRWPVLIRDYASYIWTNQVQVSSGTSGGNTLFHTRVTFQPVTGTRFLHRRALAIDESEETAILKVNGTPLSRGAWTINDFGILAVPTGDVSSGAVVTLSFMELTAACFVNDSLTYKVMAQGSDSPISGIQDCQLREIPEQELIDLMAQTDDSV